MFKRIFGIILVVLGAVVFHFLTSDFETAFIWRTVIENKVMSDPLEANGNFIFWAANRGKNLYKIYTINSSGQIMAESQNLPNTPFDPIIIGNNIIMSDHGRMIRAFSSVDLKPIWEAATKENLDRSPIQCGENVLQYSGKTLYCLNSENGEVIWDETVVDGIKNYASDKVVVLIHGYKDVAKPLWRCTAYDIELGTTRWALKEPVSKDKPYFIQNTCVLTTAEGEVIVLNQYSGEILYRSEAKGFVVIQALNEGVLLANKDYTNFAYLSFITGEAWTHSLQVDFMGAAEIGSHIVIADKKSLRCFNKESGLMEWQKDLGDVYGCFPHRDGAFVTYKQDFTSRTTYGVCVGADSMENIWLAKGTSIFKKPYALNEGDLLLNYDGTIRLMPKPLFKYIPEKNASDTPDIARNLKKIYEAKLQKNKQNTAQSTTSEPITTERAKHTTTIKKKSNEAIPSVLPPISDEDVGW